MHDILLTFSKKLTSSLLSYCCTGWDVTENELEEVAEYSNVLNQRHDYLEPNFCQMNVLRQPNECIEAYL